MSFTTGKDVYATAGAGRTRDDELDASTLDLGFEAGADIAVGPERRDFLCPVVAFSVSLGRNDYLLQPEDYRYVSGALGFGLGTVVIRSPQLAVILAGGVRVARLKVTLTRKGYETTRQVASDTYAVISIGAGLSLHETLTIRPGVSVPFSLVGPGDPEALAKPFGREEREVSLGISVGVSFGRRSRASR